MTAIKGQPPHATTSGPAVSLNSRIGKVAAASAVALVFGEVVSLVQTIALARLLSPAEVGMFVAGTVLTTFLGNFVEGGLRSGLIHREGDLSDAAETVFWTTAVAGLAMGIAALALSPVVGIVFHSTLVGQVAAASSGLLFLYSFTNVPEALLQRSFSVRRRLVVGPSVGLSYAGVTVILAALGWGVWAMVAGLYASYVTWVVSVWLLTDWRPRRGRYSRTLWRELARYGSPLVLGMMGARVQQVVETVVVGRGLSSASLGQYRYGQRIAQIPPHAIVEVGAISLFPAFSRLSREPGRLKHAYLRALRLATVGAAALSGLMIALGIPTVVIVLGERWREAGVVVMAMAGLGLGKALISVSEEAIKGGGRTGLLNWYTLTETALGVVLLVTLINFFGLVGVGLAVSITAIVVGVTCIALARRVVGFTVREVCAMVLPQLPCAALATAACAALEHLVMHSDARGLALGIVFVCADAVVFTVVYAGSLRLVMPEVVGEFWSAAARWLGRLRRRRTALGEES